MQSPCPAQRCPVATAPTFSARRREHAALGFGGQNSGMHAAVSRACMTSVRHAARNWASCENPTSSNDWEHDCACSARVSTGSEEPRSLTQQSAVSRAQFLGERLIIYGGLPATTVAAPARSGAARAAVTPSRPAGAGSATRLRIPSGAISTSSRSSITCSVDTGPTRFRRGLGRSRGPEHWPPAGPAGRCA